MMDKRFEKYSDSQLITIMRDLRDNSAFEVGSLTRTLCDEIMGNSNTLTQFLGLGVLIGGELAERLEKVIGAETHNFIQITKEIFSDMFYEAAEENSYIMDAINVNITVDNGVINIGFDIDAEDWGIRKGSRVEVKEDGHVAFHLDEIVYSMDDLERTFKQSFLTYVKNHITTC